MTGAAAPPPASVAGCGLCAVLAAVALGLGPARRLSRAGAARTARLVHPRTRSPRAPRASAARCHGPAQRLTSAARRLATAAATRPRRRRARSARRHPAGSPGGAGPADAPGGPSSPAGTPPGSGEALHAAALAAGGAGERRRVPLHPSRTTVPAGKVIIEFVNNGQDEHNLNAQGVERPARGHVRDRDAENGHPPDGGTAARLLHAVLLAGRTRGERHESHAHGRMSARPAGRPYSGVV